MEFVTTFVTGVNEMELFGMDFLKAVLFLVGIFAVLGYVFYWVAKISLTPDIAKKAKFFDKFISRAYIDLNKHKDLLCKSLNISRQQYDDALGKDCDTVKKFDLNPDNELLRWAFNSTMKDNGYIYFKKPYDSRLCIKCKDNTNKLLYQAKEAVTILEEHSSRECEHFFEEPSEIVEEHTLLTDKEDMCLTEIIWKTDLIDFIESDIENSEKIIINGIAINVFVSINGERIYPDISIFGIKVWKRDDKGNFIDLNDNIISPSRIKIEFPRIKADGLMRVIQVDKDKCGNGPRKSVRVRVCRMMNITSMEK